MLHIFSKNQGIKTASTQPDIFSYRSITRCEGNKLIIQSAGYQAFQSVLYDDHFIFVKNILHPYVLEYAKNTDKGYKLYVSLDDSELDDNLERGWTIVKDILMRHHVYYFKVIRNSSRQLLLESERSGQEIIIYAFKEARNDWDFIIQEMTYELEKENIRPGVMSECNTQIAHSKYVSYCNDGIMGISNLFR
jgi:hypothetical protein